MAIVSLDFTSAGATTLWMSLTYVFPIFPIFLYRLSIHLFLSISPPLIPFPLTLKPSLDDDSLDPHPPILHPRQSSRHTSQPSSRPNTTPLTRYDISIPTPPVLQSNWSVGANEKVLALTTKEDWKEWGKVAGLED